MPMPSGKIMSSEESQMGVATRWDAACEDLRQKGERQRAAAAKVQMEKSRASSRLASNADLNDRLRGQRDASAMEGHADSATSKAKSEEYDALLDDDTDLDKLRQARLTQLKKEKEQLMNNKAKGHGHYNEIVEDQFLKTVTNSKFAIVHFYCESFERCKIMDKHLRLLANKHVETKFVKMNAEKTPFFVEKLAIRTLPTLAIFCDGCNVDRVVGFDQLDGGDEFSTRCLEERIGLTGAIKMERAFYEQDDNALDRGEIIKRSKKPKRIMTWERDDMDDDGW